jgi:hypothetical protein
MTRLGGQCDSSKAGDVVIDATARPFQTVRTQFRPLAVLQQTTEHLSAFETLFNLQANPMPEL